MDYYDDRQRKVSVKDVIDIIAFILDDDVNRHIVGGALLSVSFLFGGLAVTAITTKRGDKDELESQVVREDIRTETDSAAYAEDDRD